MSPIITVLMASAYRGGGLRARCFAAAAGLGADAAMLVILGVLLAFGGAKRAGFFARPQGRNDHALIGTGAARGNAGRCIAQVGAIEIKPNTLPQLQHHVLAEARIGARGTRLRTVQTFLDALDEIWIGIALNGRMRAKHLLNVHGGFLKKMGRLATGDFMDREITHGRACVPPGLQKHCDRRNQR